MASGDQLEIAPLTAVKLLHTAIWAVLAGAISALPVLAMANRFDWALAITILVAAECVVLALNRGQCPLTGFAARYTADRADNFDIYLPEWLARYNKAIFGALFVAGEIIVIWRWVADARKGTLP
jgi:hypothetical protein